MCERIGFAPPCFFATGVKGFLQTPSRNIENRILSDTGERPKDERAYSDKWGFGKPLRHDSDRCIIRHSIVRLHVRQAVLPLGWKQ